MPKWHAVLRKPAAPKQTAEPTQQEQPVAPGPGKLKGSERAMVAIALKFAGNYRRPGPLLSGIKRWGAHES
jgi:hypothetical protein